MKARAMATRCCSPPESRGGRWCRRSPSPTAASSSRALGSQSRSPRSSAGSITFSSAVMVGSSRNDWKTKPICSARNLARPSSSSSPSDLPRISMEPRLGRSSPASNPSKVDLPDPEAPTSATVSPLLTCRSIPSRMVRLSWPRLTDLPRPLTTIMGVELMLDILCPNPLMAIHSGS